MTFSFIPFIRKQFAVILFIGSLASCSIAPVSNHFESARTLGKNNIEASANVSRYVQNNDLSSDPFSNNNFGFRLGYGVCDQFDVKLRYERLVPGDESSKDYINGVNFLSLESKYSFIDKILAVKLPINYYGFTNKQSNEMGNEISINPTIIGTLPVRDVFDASLAVSYHKVLNEDYDPFLAFSLGMGFSSDLNAWAVRPELGYVFDTQESSSGYFNYGIAFLYHFDLKQ